MSTVVNYNAAGGGGGSGTVTNINNILNTFITNNNYTATGNGLLAGGGVIWMGNYNFTVAKAVYQIAGAQYTSAQTDITLSAADPTLDRIDVIAVDNTGVVVVLQGTPSATPSPPSVDPTTQLALSFVYVTANTTQPVNVSNEDIYLENTEWTGTASGAGFNLASTNNPFQGTKDIEATGVIAGNSVSYVKPAAGTIDPGVYNSLAFYIRSKGTWPAAKQLTIQLYNGTTPVGQPVAFTGTSFNWSSAVTGVYQLVVIPIGVFQAAGEPITTIKATVAGTGGSIGFYLDYWLFQSGVLQIPLAAPMIYQGDWVNTKAYATNDVVTVGAAAARVSYIALSNNVNQDPSTATTVWKALSAVGAGTGSVTSITAANGARTVSGAAITTTGVLEGDSLTNAQTGTSYALLTGDRGKAVTFSNAASIAVTLAQAGTAGFPDGWYTDVKNLGVGTVTITPTTSTINGAASLALLTGQSARVVSNGTNYVVLALAGSVVGDGTLTSLTAANGARTSTGAAITGTGIIQGDEVTNAQVGTSYTVQATDRGKLVTLTNGAAIAVTLPQASATFPDGWYCDVRVEGAGTATITPTTSTINGAATLALTTGQSARIVSDGTNYHALTGGASASGTVTSVAASGGVQTTTGSPITASGTIQGAYVINAQTGTTYAILAGDRGKHVTLSNAASIAASIAQAGTAGFENGYFAYLENIGVGAVTITPATSTINGGATFVLNAGQAGILFSDGTNYRIVTFASASGLSVNAQTGTTYTYLSGDRGKLVTHTNGSAIAGALPQATGAFGAGWFMWVENRGAGTLTITPTTSTIDGAASLALLTNQGALIASDGTNYFTMRGMAGLGLVIASGKTLTVSNSLTLAGTDSTTMTFPPVSASIGYLNVPQNSQSADYTTVAGDAGYSIDHPSTDNVARTFTIAANASVAYALGTCISFSNVAATAIAIAINSDTMYLGGTTTTGTRSLAQGGHCTARKVAATVWIISGPGLS